MSKLSLADRLVNAWYAKSVWLWLLAPLSWLFALVVAIRHRWLNERKPLDKSQLAPVVVVGNITVGGAGKSPLVAYLVRAFEDQGLRAGVVSRGYGALSPIDQPVVLTGKSTAGEVGDEPLMLYQQLGCPVCVCPKRSDAVARLTELGCDIVISDDGLQHYAMQRDIEICVFDAQRLWGNGWLLPAGPLREPLSRLGQVDYIVFNGGDAPSPEALLAAKPERCLRMDLTPQDLQALDGSVTLALEQLKGASISAIAGIGHPVRFFNTLEALGAKVTPYAFGDHHSYHLDDFSPILEPVAGTPIGGMIVMTEKDAVKCRNISLENAWYLPVSAQLSDNLAHKILARLYAVGRLTPNGRSANASKE